MSLKEADIQALSDSENGPSKSDKRSKDSKTRISELDRVDSNYAEQFEPLENAKTDRTLDLYDGSLDPVYQAKARVLNAAIQEIGMGKYQVCVPVSQSVYVL